MDLNRSLGVSWLPVSDIKAFLRRLCEARTRDAHTRYEFLCVCVVTKQRTAAIDLCCAFEEFTLIFRYWHRSKLRADIASCRASSCPKIDSKLVHLCLDLSCRRDRALAPANYLRLLMSLEAPHQKFGLSLELIQTAVPELTGSESAQGLPVRLA